MHSLSIYFRCLLEISALKQLQDIFPCFAGALESIRLVGPRAIPATWHFQVGFALLNAYEVHDPLLDNP